MNGADILVLVESSQRVVFIPIQIKIQSSSPVPAAFAEMFIRMLSGQLTGSPFVLLFSVLSGLWFLNYVKLFFFQYKNLEKPYSTNCSMKTLNTYSTYTSEGCADECETEGIVKLCGCRPVGYKGTFLSFLRLFSINAIVIAAASTRICRIQMN